MAMLEQLKLTNAAPMKDRSPAGRHRRKLIDAIDLQIELAAADGAGTVLTKTRQRWVRNDAGGKDLRELPVRLRRWWWRDDGGRVFLSLRRGSRILELAPGKAAIEVGTLAELPAQLAILREAVLAGELDHCVAPTPASRGVPGQAEGLDAPQPAAELQPGGQRGTKKGTRGQAPAASA